VCLAASSAIYALLEKNTSDPKTLHELQSDFFSIVAAKNAVEKYHCPGIAHYSRLRSTFPDAVVSLSFVASSCVPTLPLSTGYFHGVYIRDCVQDSS
jgi:hypothetical protein